MTQLSFTGVVLDHITFKLWDGHFTTLSIYKNKTWRNSFTYLFYVKLQWQYFYLLFLRPWLSQTRRVQPSCFCVILNTRTSTFCSITKRFQRLNCNAGTLFSTLLYTQLNANHSI